MGPAALAQVLRPLRDTFRIEEYPNLLNDMDEANDAALYALDDGRIMIQNVDFFPPMVDDPYWFGAIAAANAMSDVYAIGGEVAMALNIAEMPEDLPLDYLSEIIRGGGDKVREAGAVIAGGHTLTDRVPKYGLSVTGFVDRAHLLTKAGAQPGDVILLTKPLGTGALLTAEKKRKADPEHVMATVRSMAELNRTASQVFGEMRDTVHAVTDVTGFGLLGHGCEMAHQSGARIVLAMNQLPFLAGSCELALQGIHCSATERNSDFFGHDVEMDTAIPNDLAQLLFGSESSGGLLASVAPDAADAIRERIISCGARCWLVGHVTDGDGMRVASSL